MRAALIVACDEYEDAKLGRLRAPTHDAEALARVLGDPEIGDYQVRTLLNRGAYEINQEIEGFFSDRRKDDLLVLYFSCHGIKDDNGRLHFAARDTKMRRLAATGISSVFVNEQIDLSRSKRKILLLDCCYSGAFARGLAARADPSAHVKESFGGHGLAVITASDAMEYAWEGDELTLDASRNSVFTTCLVRGLETGEADGDGDGQISVGDLYDYLFEHVREAMPGQTPTKSEQGVRGEMIIARSVRPPQPTLLPREIQMVMTWPVAEMRLGAVAALGAILGGDNPGQALAARQALEEMRADESFRVRQAVESELDDPVITPRVVEEASGPLAGEAAPARHDAYLEIAVRWEAIEGAAYLAMFFEAPSAGLADSLPAVGPLAFALGEPATATEDERAYGELLTRTFLDHGEAKPFYALARAKAESAGLDLHVRLSITGPAAFQSIRWETLRDPHSRRPIATEPTMFLSRYVDDQRAEPARLTTRRHPRALIVAASPGGIDVDGELRRARAALTGFAVDELLPGAASPSAVVNALRPGVDVLFLICPSEKPDRPADVIDARFLADLIAESAQPPTLVVLLPGVTLSAGRLLSTTGVAGVVALQAAVPAQTMSTFLGTFFSSFARHGVIDRSMTDARQAISGHAQWWAPVLFSRLRSGRAYFAPSFALQSNAVWNSVKVMTMSGRLTPLIGADLSAPIVGSLAEIAARWTRNRRIPLTRAGRGNLPEAAQYVRVARSRAAAVREFLTQLGLGLTERGWSPPGDPNPNGAISEAGRHMRAADPDEPHSVLAGMRAAVYVTTSWTSLLEDALRDAGRTPVTGVFSWNSAAAGPPEQARPTVDAPLVFHLHGHLDDPESVVLTEDDYLEWLSAWASRRKSMPTAVLKALAANSLMILGFDLGGRWFRQVFRAITELGGSSLLRQNAHFAVQESPSMETIEPEAAQEYLGYQYGEDNVSLYWGDPRTFCRELRRRLEQRP
ncbi:SIR2 family protein [Actinoplanes sp. NPDC000266]